MSGSQATTQTDDTPEVVIEFEDDAPPATEGGAPPKTEDREPVSQEDLRALLERGKRQIEAERQARDRAEARAAELERAAQEAQGALRTQTGARFQAEESALDVAISAAEREADALVAQIGQLQADGNFADAAKMQRALARAEANAASLSERKASLATARLAAATEAPPTVTRQDAPAAGQIDLSRYSQPQRKWIRDHPEYLEDDKLRTRLAGAHFLAVSEGCEIDSPEYFAVLENAYDKHFQRPGGAEATPEPAQTTSRQGAPAMPVTRRAPGAPPAPNTIRLTPEEREAADITMPDVPENSYRDSNGTLMPGRYELYVKNRAALVKQGRLMGRAS